MDDGFPETLPDVVDLTTGKTAQWLSVEAKGVDRGVKVDVAIVDEIDANCEFTDLPDGARAHRNESAPGILRLTFRGAAWIRAAQD